LSPYALVGIGLYNFKPQGLTSDGAWVDLKPLKTEGQGLVDGRIPYKLTQLNVPIGFGLKWTYNDTWSMALEVNHRLTFTDYIDDVSTTYFSPTLISQKYGPVAAQLSNRSNPASPDYLPLSTGTGQQRGDPTDKDAYMMGTITLTYRLKSGRSVLPKFR
jgi:hypothetical protein